MRCWLALLLFGCLPALAQHSAVGEAKQQTIEVQGQQVEVLSHPWAGRQHHGAVIMLPSLGQPAQAPGLIAYLRDELPIHGWATFSIAAPALPAPINFTTKAEDVSKAGDGTVQSRGNQASAQRSDEEWQQLRQAQQQYLGDAIKQVTPLMQQYPGGWILVTENQTAALVMEMIAQRQLTMPNLLVVVNPYSADPEYNRQLANNYGLFAMPVLDLQSPDGAPASLATQAQRQLKLAEQVARRSRQQQLALNLSQPTAYAECLSIIRGMSVAALR